jgi:hypothetical protein
LPAGLVATVLGDGAIKGGSPAKKVEIGQAKVKNCQLAFGLIWLAANREALCFAQI